MKKTKFKRLLSLFLTLTMLLTLVATSVVAADDADSETETTTSSDASEESSGVDVYYAGEKTGNYSTLKDAYKATVDGGTMKLMQDFTDEQLGASSNKTVTLDLNGYTISKNSGSVIDCSNGTLYITDSSDSGNGLVQGTGGVAIKVSNANGNVVLQDGTLQSTSTYAVSISAGTLTVEGGSVIAASTVNCIVYYTGGTVTVKDGLFTNVSPTSVASEEEEEEQEEDSTSATTVAIVNAGSSATINNENVQVSISGGVFQTDRPLRGTSINLEITGGYFKSNYSLNNYCPDGYGYSSVESYEYLGNTYSDYYQVAHINFTVTVKESSEEEDDDENATTDAYYASPSQAISAAITAYGKNSNAEITITLNNNYETDKKVPVETTSTAKFTFDLNGYTFTSDDKGAFKINAASVEITITDSSIDGTGTITTVDEVTSSTTTGLLQVQKGTLNITGGHFNQNAGSTVFVVSTGATVSVTGGYFTSNPSDYVGDGYVMAETGDTIYKYTVLSKSAVNLSSSSSGSEESATVSATYVSGYGTDTVYAGVSATDVTSNYSTTSYPTTSLTYTPDNTAESGSYIFAGWYTLNNDGSYTACTSDMWGTAATAAEEDEAAATEETTTADDVIYYAKFVDANMVSIQCAFTYDVSGMGNIWRFFSGVDAQNYTKFTFTVMSGEETVKTTLSPKVYPTSYTVGGVSHTFYAYEFGDVGYIVTDYYADSAKTLTTCNVYGSWTTADGTVIVGSTYTFTQTGTTAVLTAVDTQTDVEEQ